MNFKVKAAILMTIFNINLLYKIEALFLHPNVAEDISEDYINYDKEYKPKKDLRRAFLEKKIRKEEQNIDLQLLQKILKSHEKKMLYSEEIAHFQNRKGSKLYNATRKLEGDFLRLLKMRNVKYMFKRDMYWRTWREVIYPNGSRIIFNYRSNNLVDIKPNCTNCFGNSGYWNIDDMPPPCPYEIFFISTASLFCGITHQKITNRLPLCPMKIRRLDFMSRCSNPVVTKWKFEIDYSKRSHKNSKFIAEGRDDFEIITLYRIEDKGVIFQIINSTNEVIYSKIMRPRNVNYVCLEDCGVFNPITLKIDLKDAPLSLDLLNAKTKKRENKNGGKKRVLIKKRLILTTPLNLELGHCDDYETEHLAQKRKREKYTQQGREDDPRTPMSLCRKLALKNQALEIESENGDYSY